MARAGTLARRTLPAALVAALVQALLAQAPQQQPVPALGAISGVVTDGVTGDALDGVVVALNGGGVGHRTVTDARGRYVFLELPAGTFYISATKSGFIDAGIARRSGINAVTFPLAHDEWIADANFTMWRPGAISGRIVDERGEPVVGVSVHVLTKIPIAGNSYWGAGPSVQTDDRGVYRITGLGPSAYIVSVPLSQASVPPGTGAAQLLGVGGTSMQAKLPKTSAIESGNSWIIPKRGGLLASRAGEVYPTFFYPGTRSFRDALSVDLGANEEKSGIDFSVHPVRASAIHGQVEGPSSVLGRLIVRLLHDGATGLGAGSEQATALVAADGSFVMPHVPEGQYVLDARTVTNELDASAGARLPNIPGLAAQDSLEFFSWMAGGFAGSLYSRTLEGADIVFARQPVTVGSRPVEVKMRLATGGTIRGRIEVEGGRFPAKATVYADVASGDPESAGPGYQTVESDGTFVIRGLHDADYFLRVAAGTMKIKSINGPGGDFTTRPISVGADSEISGVTIRLVDASASIAGAVTDRAGAPVRQAAVILFPADPERWRAFGVKPDRIRSAMFLGNQGFEITFLPAGEYFVIAVDPAARDSWQDPRFLKAAAAAATKVRLDWGSRTAQDLIVQTIKPR